MVDLTMDVVHSLMRNITNIRNISVIAHVDHGKSTLTDCLVIKARVCGVDQGGGRYMDTRADEQERGITIKSTAISMHFAISEASLKTYMSQAYNGREFLINLIDSPGHVDFSSEVTAALRVTDGALVVVDCVDGICVQTETVLRQAIAERIKPTLCLNKLDRAILELNQSKEDLYKSLRKQVENFNVKLEMISASYQNAEFNVSSLDPGLNEVSFCSGLQQWGFTMKQFARLYGKRFKLNEGDKEAKMCKFFWDERSYWTVQDPFDLKGRPMKNGRDSQRAFVVFVLGPIYKVRALCDEGKKKEIVDYLKLFDNVKLQEIEDCNLKGKELFKLVMRNWLPAADSLLEQIVVQLPSPCTSQKYRASLLYEGPKDECYQAIMDTNSKEDAPLMIYISKMVPHRERFIAFGRVLSGTVYAGMKVRIQGPDYNPESEIKSDFTQRAIQRTVVMMGKGIKDIPDCPAGNIIGLVGIDSDLKKTGTITTHPCAYNIKQMKFSVSPVVKYSVRPKKPADLPKLKDGLVKLSKSDPLSVINFNDNGELTIAGAGELHLEICFHDLKTEYANIELVKGEPIVSYLEGIKGETADPKMAKSANKHNRIYMTCEQLDETVVENILNGRLVHKDVKIRAQLFREVLGIRDDWVKKVMYYGSEDKGPNLLVDETKGIAYLNEIKEYMREGFRDVTARGPLIGENLRGVRFNLVDVTLHSDAIHRTGNQITSPFASVCRGLVLNSEPILYEPLFRVEINVSNDAVSAAVNVLNRRRGLVEEYDDEGGMRTVVKGFLPVRESFGFNANLMDDTKGQASCVLSFSHYSVLPGSLVDKDSIMSVTVEDIRVKRKMGSLEGPDYFFDKL